MFRYISLLCLPLLIVDGTTNLIQIKNGAYVSSDGVSFNGTCSQCLCYAFGSGNSSSYQALDCYSNQTCTLFPTYISQSMIHVNINSILFFLQSQVIQTTTQKMTSVATSTSQCYIPTWNSTGITMVTAGTNLSQVMGVYGLFIAANSDVLYIADTDSNRVLQWPAGATSGTLVAGGLSAGSNATQLYRPTEVCADNNSNVFVTDSGNYRIQYYRNGSLVGQTVAGNGTPGAVNNSFGNLFGLGVDLANNFYASEYDKNRVTRWSLNSTYGVMVAGFGGAGNDASQLDTPTAFYTDPATGTLYIPNQGSHCITKWVPGNSTGTTVAGVCGVSGANETLLTSPSCVTFDKYGNMYVTDHVNSGRILMFCPNSLVGIVIVSSGLNNPMSIAVDKNLNLYVADFSNNRIVKYPLL